MARWMKIMPFFVAKDRGFVSSGLGSKLWTAFLLVFCIATVSLALCTSYRRRRRGKDEERHFPSKLGFLFRKVLSINNAKKAFLKCGRQSEPFEKIEENEMEESDEIIWKRKILMGERCRPPNFSGAILYDDKGNRLPQFPSRPSRPSLA